VATGLFDHAAEQLERHTHLNHLEARGTLRLAVKEAGLDAKSLTLPQLTAVFEKVMPSELEDRGIEAAATTCRTILAEITRTADPADTASTGGSDEIFQRLGGQ